ncbi:MAG: YggS family pyridoxal phosphate-dependent enzyme, partial [Planctomycetota bacterium]
LVEHILGVRGLRFEGLMTMAPFFEDGEKARPYFARLRELSERLRRNLGVVCRLSMGMTADYEVAVEEGATDVRIGTAIVGGL